VNEELFPRLRTLQDVWDYVWSGYAVTIDARRRVLLGVRHEPRLPLAIAEPGPLMTHAVCLAVQQASPSSSSASCSTCWTPGGSNVALSSSGRAGPWSKPQSSYPIEPATSSRRSCSGADEPQGAVTPRRLQLSRKPGWPKPPEAVVVVSAIALGQSLSSGHVRA
jgi:hypothetical protein